MVGHMPGFRKKTTVPYTARQMFDLVADVERYPEFLPWCSACRIEEASASAGRKTMLVEMVIAFKLFRERYSSRVLLDESRMAIEIGHGRGLFRSMASGWGFRDLAEGGSEVEYHIDYELRSLILQKTLGLVFKESQARIMRSFEARADEIYGA